MKVVFSPEHARHEPQLFLVRGQPKPSAEQPERAERLLAAVQARGDEILAPAGLGPGPLAAVHTPDYLRFLEEAWDAWQALGDSGGEIIPNVHPAHHQASYPRAIVGRAGWHMADTACPIGPGTFAAACAAADAAATGAELLLDGETQAYALCRPPGHHAYADMAGGFCFLNNAAIAAQRLRRAHERVAILDVDVHHGNGTQGIFYQRPDVLTVSLHADPQDFYPFFWGHGHERGAGPGLGYNLNLPLPIGTADDGWLAALERHALPAIRAFAPGALVVALGLDAFEGDPLRGLAITTPGFARIAAAIARLGLPTLLVQEGGYLAPELGGNLASFLGGFEEAR
ncbi:Acetoin utilization deacetylase AcuC [Tistlia consotensis]|uniref:Acetoin utilization deacetylase AcuC n=1 Tax=Tistlia consotensis USBA 355 TaxID=560819 RepID=A0A1Y6CNC7_9PROT|nr:histone deacetylase family protein [Tistlia consotensis]SMF77176.1 Acetoin utilization deacetylase AcuC [Tistlia consotensis USBA 355]SNS14343.1 Acetoin utilization deacetylase AcuC [Tistlia consotensis]